MGSNIDRENDLILLGMIKGAAVIIKRLREEAKTHTDFKILPGIADGNDSHARKAAILFGQEAYNDFLTVLETFPREIAIDKVIKELQPVLDQFRKAREELIHSVHDISPSKKSFH
jgi:hypothetical protein